MKIFAGKAAASYHRAKLIIKLINDVAHVVNNDPALRGLLKVVFLPELQREPGRSGSFRHPTCPSRSRPPGMEASGTGNMKLALNGALTIGTLDGANIEIRDRVGDDNIFIFGLTAAQVDAAARAGYQCAGDDRGLGAAASGAGCDRLRPVLARGTRPLPRPG